MPSTVMTINIIVIICILLKSQTTFGNHEARPDIEVFEYGQSVVIKSPNYPENYPTNSNILWLVSGPADDEIVAVFKSFEIEFGYDLLVVGSGLDPNDTSSILVTLTGYELPDDVVSNSNEMWLEFKSDDLVSERGFEIEIRVYTPLDVTEQCEGNSTDHDELSILSPNYPDNYPLNANIHWLVSGPANYQIMAVFRGFEIEEGYDFLRIGSGLDPNDTSSILATLTGYRLPDDVVSNSNKMWLEFTSDSFVTQQGFMVDIKIFNLENASENQTAVLYDMIVIRNFSYSSNVSDLPSIFPETVQCYEESCYDGVEATVCRCDEMCRFFGDCCPDYPLSNDTLRNGSRLNEIVPDPSVWECIQDTFLPQFYPELGHGYRMITRCPSDWTLDDDVKRSCEGTHDVNRTEDALYVQGDTYFRNLDCAICNGLEESSLTSIVIAAGEPCWWAHNGTLECYKMQGNTPHYNFSTEIVGSMAKVYHVPEPRLCLLDTTENCTNGTNDLATEECRYYYKPFISNEGVVKKHPACGSCNVDHVFECDDSEDPLPAPPPPPPPSPDLKGALDIFVMPAEEFQMEGEQRAPPPCQLTGYSQCSAISSNWPTCEYTHTIVAPRNGSSDCLEEMLCLRQVTTGDLTFTVQVPSPCLNKSSTDTMKESEAFTWIYTDSIIPPLETMRSDILQRFPTRNECMDSVVSVSNFCYSNSNVNKSSQCTGDVFIGQYLDFIPSSIDNETLIFTNGTYIQPKWWSNTTEIEFSNANTSSAYELTVCGTEVTLQTCSFSTVFNESIEWIVHDNQSFISHQGQLYGADDFLVNPDGSVNICFMTQDTSSSVRTFIIFAHTLFALSSLCLLATFVTYIVFPTLRNRQGVSIMNFIAALFIGQILLQYVRLLVSQSPTKCLVVGALSHFFVLASFVWTTILAWDLSRSFAASNLKSFSTSTFGRKMVAYLTIGWGIPLVFVLMTLTVQFGGFRIGQFLEYSNRTCWLSGLGSITMFFGPMAVCLLSNLVLFIITIHGVHSTKKTTSMLKHGQESQLKQWMAELKIYAKISGILGFAWLFGFLAMVVIVSFTEYIFLIAMGLQGILIFVSFGANERVRKLWRTSAEGSTIWTQLSQRYSRSRSTISSG